MRGGIDTSGYRTIAMKDKHNSSCFKKWHRVVWECWRGIIPAGMQVDHIDGDRLNNSLANLQLLNPKDHRAKTLRCMSAPFRMHTRDFDGIVRADAAGKEMLFASVADALAQTPGARRDSILHCTGGRYKTHMGYCWRWMPAPVIANEVWCSLLGKEYAGIEVSDMGRVRGRHYRRISNGFSCNSYLHTKIGNKRMPVHRLVCRAFHGMPTASDLTVDHIDRDRHNNRASNLRWATRAQQCQNRKRRKL